VTVESALFPDYRCPSETDDQRLLRKHATDFFHKEATPNQERWAQSAWIFGDDPR
jgi:acyl-CoA dehydrogenase